jgi:hypothetical protein
VLGVSLCIKAPVHFTKGSLSHLLEHNVLVTLRRD